jgi:hydroxyacylglutathione hydrolase
MILETFKVGPMECNCSIVVCPDTRNAIVVDPGGNADLLIERLRSLNATLKSIVITHAHFDHVIAARQLREATGAQVCLHRKDIWLYRVMPLQYRMSGIKDKRPPRVNRFLAEGDTVSAGNIEFSTLHTPGHSPGSICLHCASQKLLFSGDTLFRLSVGNWRFPGGSLETLLASIERLGALPDDTRVIPGHMEETTIGFERANSQYFQPAFLEELKETERAQPRVTVRSMLWAMIKGMFSSR